MPLPNRLFNLVVVRQEAITDDIPQEGDFSFHFHPFESLKFRSHIHPRYAIYEMGRKLRYKVSKEDAKLFEEAHPDLFHKITAIYNCWTQPVPDNAENDDPFFRPKTPEYPTSDASYDTVY